MKEKLNEAWLTLNTNYYPSPIGNPLALLDDAQILMERAHGVVRVMREALQLSACVDKDALAHSLKAAETLMEMASGSAEEAHVRFITIGDAWIGSLGEERASD
jgi:hypothetical protein